MRFFISLAILITAFAFSGCANKKKDASDKPAMTGDATSVSTNAPSAKEKIIITPDNTLNGKIALVNNPGKFVVINFPLGQMPVIGLRMNVYRRGLKVGEVSVAGPQRENNIIADVTAGEAEKGDEVRDR